jgi:hypothetical protein
MFSKHTSVHVSAGTSGLLSPEPCFVLPVGWQAGYDRLTDRCMPRRRATPKKNFKPVRVALSVMGEVPLSTMTAPAARATAR